MEQLLWHQAVVDVAAFEGDVVLYQVWVVRYDVLDLQTLGLQFLLGDLDGVEVLVCKWVLEDLPELKASVGVVAGRPVVRGAQ